MCPAMYSHHQPFTGAHGEIPWPLRRRVPRSPAPASLVRTRLPWVVGDASASHAARQFTTPACSSSDVSSVRARSSKLLTYTRRSCLSFVVACGGRIGGRPERPNGDSTPRLLAALHGKCAAKLGARHAGHPHLPCSETWRRWPTSRTPEAEPLGPAAPGDDVCKWGSNQIDWYVVGMLTGPA